MSTTIEPTAAADPEETPAPVDLTKHHDQEDQAVAEAGAGADAEDVDGEQAEEADAEGEQSLKERAAALVGEGGPVRAHLDRAWRNTGSWLATQDVTDEQLVEDLLKQRAVTHKQRETELRRQIGRVSSEIIAAKRAETADPQTNDVHRDGDAVAALKGKRELLETQLREHREALPELLAEAPSEGEVGRARWGRKASRAAALVAGVVGGGIYLPMQDPAWLLAALPAAAVALWRAGAIPQDTKEKGEKGEKAAAAAAPRIPGQAVPAGAEGSAFAPAPVVPAGVPVAVEDLVRPEAAAEPVGEVERASHDWLMERLLEAGIVTAETAKRTKVISMLTQGPGWTATVELAPGRKAAEAIARSGELASALARKASQIEMTADTSAEGHEGRFTMWVSDAANPYGGRPVKSVLVDAAIWDFWGQGVPLGADARGVRKILDLLWQTLLVGGLQRYGKTYFVRLIAAAAALDPHVRIVLISGKTAPDWLPLKKVATCWVVGNTPDTVRRAHEAIEWVIEDLQMRGEALTALAEKDPKAVPEGKITPALARDPEFGLTLLLVDELQNLLIAAGSVKSGPRVNDPSYASLIRDSLTVYNRLTASQGGMAVGVVHRLGPDSPVTTDLRDAYSQRACYRVKGIDSARNILGPDAVRDGAAPHSLLEVHKGVAVVDLGEDGGHYTMKADVITIEEFGEICERGRRLRIQAGTLTGYAAQTAAAEQVDTVRRGVIEDVLEAMEALGGEGARLEELAVRMAEDRPEQWADLTPEQLGEQLRQLGAGTTVKLPRREDGSRPNGYRREQIAALLKGPKSA